MDKGNSNQTLIIKLVCVLLSFGLWLYVTNIQNTTREYTLKGVPVNITNTSALKEDGLALAPNQTFTVDLDLEGYSKYIYAATKSQFSLSANLGEYALKQGVNNIPVQVKNYPSELNIKNNGNLVIKVKLEKLITKQFNTISQVNVDYAKGVYKQKEQFNSEKVEVSGPQSAVDKVANVALVGNLEGISENLTKEFPLKPVDSYGNVVDGVTLSKNVGTISIAVNNGKSVDVTTEFTGSVPNGYKLVSTNPSKTSVQIVGDQKAVDSVNSLKTESIDLSSITSNTEKNVKIILPNGIKVSDGNNYITVKINVEKIGDSEASKELEVPVSYTGLNSNLELSNETKSIKFNIQGNKKDIDNLKASDFTCKFDLSKFKDEGDFEEQANVKMTSSNSDISISNTSTVKFTLKKKENQKDNKNTSNKKSV